MVSHTCQCSTPAAHACGAEHIAQRQLQVSINVCWHGHCMQVDALRGRLHAGQRREVGLLGLLAGVAALAVPRMGLGKAGALLRASVLVGHHVSIHVAYISSQALLMLCSLLLLSWQTGASKVLAAANGVVGLANFAWCRIPDGKLALGGLGAFSRQPGTPELPLQLMI